ncbi:tetratricopeptide repeat protein [Kitasatospora sp. NPDC057692]|uniref:tetratricopeptide repeat protein n=1 Tax=Kitasatospora sp. NPDC057692 TaxID=3346215 RepID=UPI0036BA65A9
MTPPRWLWRGRPGGPGERHEPVEASRTGSPPQDADSACPAESTPVPGAGAAPDAAPPANRSTPVPAAGPAPAERLAGAGTPSQTQTQTQTRAPVRVPVPGEGTTGPEYDVSHRAADAGSSGPHPGVDNRVEGSTVHGGVYQASSLSVTHHHTHNYPAPSAPAPTHGPVRVGAVPPLASAFQFRPGLRTQIERARERHTTVVLTQVLSGGGGVGKSQLAAAYAHEAHAQGVDVLVWADAAEVSQVVATYAQAAAKAGVPGADGQDAECDAVAFLDWLAVTDRTWLVVLDDLTDLEGAQPWWPRPPSGPGASGRVLATTRRRDALVSGAGRAIVGIGTYHPDEARTYLHERLTAAGSAHLLDHLADDLAEALGWLPLALAHAAAYMINEDTDCTTYLALFTDRASRLEELLPLDADTDGYGRQVTTSLLLALDAAGRREPAGLAVPAIRLAAHLDPAGHPHDLWTTDAVTGYLTAHRTPPPTGATDQAPVTPAQARAALRLLHHYALLTHHAHDSSRAVRLHALTARAARETTPQTDTAATVRAAADALQTIWPRQEHTARSLAAALRANTDTLQAHADDRLWQPVGHPVLFTTGTSLTAAGLFHAAATHWQRLAADAQRLLGDDHPDTLVTRGNLADSYGHTGRTGEAIGLLEGVLADCERTLGHDHPDTLVTRGNLADFLHQAGRTGEAIGLQERVLADRERTLGHDHSHTLTARGNLAHFYGQAGRTGEAIGLLEGVLADCERTLGHDHPDTLAVRGNLADFLHQAGRTGEAIGLKERVLTDFEQNLGGEHPRTLVARASLAHSYHQVGRAGEAIGLLEGVLADCERVLGHDHPDTLAVRGNLADSYGQAGRTGEAIGLLKRVLTDCERVLGGDHPHTLVARANLADAYHQARRIGEAIVIWQRVLADRERLLGHDHRDTLVACANLADAYRRTGRTGEAIGLLEGVLADFGRVLGHDHRDTLVACVNLAVSYRRTGRTGEAIGLLEGVLADCERVLGRDYPDTLVARGSLAVSYQEVGRTGEAIGLLEGVLADFERGLGPNHPATRAAADRLRSWRTP